MCIPARLRLAFSSILDEHNKRVRCILNAAMQSELVLFASGCANEQACSIKLPEMHLLQLEIKLQLPYPL